MKHRIGPGRRRIIVFEDWLYIIHGFIRLVCDLWLSGLFDNILYVVSNSTAQILNCRKDLLELLAWMMMMLLSLAEEITTSSFRKVMTWILQSWSTCCISHRFINAMHLSHCYSKRHIIHNLVAR